ncbi:MAG: hypothetical protein IJ801_00005 [Lachnospiraceae bacterium]|nr:hypothetical protein [Lachnospiraceae bacterium]
MILKHIKRILLVLACLPFVSIGLLILFEILGMGVNHFATYRQTRELKHNLIQNISDIEILDVYSETGNTGPTGNHVDCLSVISFSSSQPLEAIQNSMEKYYEFNEWHCRIDKTEQGYEFYLNTSAPFADNIEGH